MRADIESAEYETVSDLVEAAGPLGTGYTFVKFLYEFGKTSRVDAALTRIQQEVDALRGALDQLRLRVDSLVIEDAKIKNLARTRALHDIATTLSARAFDLANDPTNRIAAASVAHEAGLLADTFLSDLDLWAWSDIRFVTPRDLSGNAIGPTRPELVEQDFKVAAALPVYSQALTVAVAGILLHVGGDQATVRAAYSGWLDKHIAHVALNHDWRDHGPGTPAATLPEKIRARMHCAPVAVSKFADASGVCGFTAQLTDEIKRTSMVLREFTVQTGGAGAITLCTIDPNSVVLDERDAEDQDDAVKTLALWEEILRTVRAAARMRMATS